MVVSQVLNPVSVTNGPGVSYVSSVIQDGDKITIDADSKGTIEVGSQPREPVAQTAPAECKGLPTQPGAKAEKHVYADI